MHAVVDYLNLAARTWEYGQVINLLASLGRLHAHRVQLCHFVALVASGSWFGPQAVHSPLALAKSLINLILQFADYISLILILPIRVMLVLLGLLVYRVAFECMGGCIFEVVTRI